MLILPEGVKPRIVENGNGLSVHFLEAGRNDAPLVLLLHGFPELAYSWRHLIAPIANLGYHVVAPDQRGYGRTTGHSAGYDVDLAEFGMVNLTKDMVGLARTLGHSSVALVVGHDYGSPVAAWGALMYPDVFHNVMLLSTPFAGPPNPTKVEHADIGEDLAGLSPPRKHYQSYFCQRDAEANMLNSRNGFPEFLRAYFYCKSADWPGNRPHKLLRWDAGELAKMPRYYIMDLEAGMDETALSMAPSKEEAGKCKWLDQVELEYYATEFQRTGLQGGLNWYRCAKSAEEQSALAAFSGQKMQAQLSFVGGAQDWGVRQGPGDFEAMETYASIAFRGTRVIENAGHWVQQEQPALVFEAIGNALKP